MSIQGLINKAKNLRKLRDTVRQTNRPKNRERSFWRFVPSVSPKFKPPRHLSPLVELLERAEDEPVRATVTTPPRHGKTQTILHWAAWFLLRHPDKVVAYVTYADRLAKSMSRRARDYARAAGLEPRRDMGNLNEWRLPEGGGFLATGIGGPLTGQGVDLLLVDDPVKDRADAESAVMRERTWDWFNDVAYTRLEPNASAIVVHTRWHPDDLIGRLTDGRTEEKWDTCKLPAIDDEGRALWADRFTVAQLLKIKGQVGEYTWWSLYQGSPRPRGGSVFNGAWFFEKICTEGYQVAIGIDLSYSAKTKNDYSVAVVLLRCGDLYFVADVLRLQVTSPLFAARLALLREQWGGAPIIWYTGGTEKGVADLITAQGLSIDARPATNDKFVRAQPVAAAWNAGKVLLPKEAPWRAEFAREIADFTGVKDPHDDQVDALAVAYDYLAGGLVDPNLSLLTRTTRR